MTNYNFDTLYINTKYQYLPCQTKTESPLSSTLCTTSIHPTQNTTEQANAMAGRGRTIIDDDEWKSILESKQISNASCGKFELCEL